MSELTMEEWVTTPAIPFQDTEEQFSELEDIIAQLQEWANKHDVPCVLLTGKAGVPGVSYTTVGYSRLKPVGKVPAEFLVAHVMATMGLEQGHEVVEEIIRADSHRANVLLRAVK